MGHPITVDGLFVTTKEKTKQLVFSWYNQGMDEKEAKEKIVDAIENGRIINTEQGQRYWDRAGVISDDPNGFAIVEANAHFWGKWEKLSGETRLGNNGGMRVEWSTISAGFGSLTIWIDHDGKLRIDTEAMGKEFVMSVLSKLFDSAIIDC